MTAMSGVPNRQPPEPPRDPRKRFSGRVENYLKYRPRYPFRIVEILREEAGLEPSWVVADVGSGTGLSTELFLRNGNPVFAVEPNEEMRTAAEEVLGDRRGFASVDGSAEETGLEPASVDLVTAGQAFHWFDGERARAEFLRVLGEGGWAAFFWNLRKSGAPGFARAYEELLLEYGTDYADVRRRWDVEGAMPAFFGGAFQRRSVPNPQRLDYEQLRGRLLSASYVPEPDDPRSRPMLQALERLFQDWAEKGQVEMDYETRLYFGRLVDG